LLLSGDGGHQSYAGNRQQEQPQMERGLHSVPYLNLNVDLNLT